MKFVFRKGREAAILVCVLLASSFLVIGIGFSPVHAAAPVVNSTTSSGACGPVLSCATAMTVLASNDVIVVAVSTTDVQAANANPATVSKVTDTLGNVYALQAGQTDKLNAPSANCSTTQCGDVEVWSATSLATGADTVTVTMTSTITNLLYGLMDVTGISSGVVNAQSFACNIATAITTNCLAGSVANTPAASFGVNTIMVAAATTTGTAYSFTVGSGYTLLATVNNLGSSQFAGAGSITPSPTFFPFTKSASADTTYWAEVGVVFPPSGGVITSTTVINTGCLGGCSTGSNSSSIYLPPSSSTFFNLHFYASQNIAGAAAQIDNVTFKVAAVHITTNTGVIQICEWVAVGVPTGGNPYTLAQPCNARTVSNGTSNFFVHVNPQAALTPAEYYAVGIMATTTGSRGSGAMGSGISVYETTTSSSPEYKFSTGSTTPPNQFFSNTLNTPLDWIFIHTIFPVATVTTTSTLTLSGLVTSTKTVTSTSTQVVNQGDPTKPAFWYIPMFYLLLFAAVFIGSYGIVNAAGRRD